MGNSIKGKLLCTHSKCTQSNNFVLTLLTAKLMSLSRSSMVYTAKSPVEGGYGYVSQAKKQ